MSDHTSAYSGYWASHNKILWIKVAHTDLHTILYLLCFHNLKWAPMIGCLGFQFRIGWVIFGAAQSSMSNTISNQPQPNCTDNTMFCLRPTTAYPTPISVGCNTTCKAERWCRTRVGVCYHGSCGNTWVNCVNQRWMSTRTPPWSATIKLHIQLSLFF